MTIIFLCGLGLLGLYANYKQGKTPAGTITATSPNDSSVISIPSHRRSREDDTAGLVSNMEKTSRNRPSQPRTDDGFNVHYVVPGKTEEEGKEAGVEAADGNGENAFKVRREFGASKNCTVRILSL